MGYHRYARRGMGGEGSPFVYLLLSIVGMMTTILVPPVFVVMFFFFIINLCFCTISLLTGVGDAPLGFQEPKKPLRKKEKPEPSVIEYVVSDDVKRGIASYDGRAQKFPYRHNHYGIWN